MTNTILSSIAVILLVTLILVALLLFVKAKITPKGKVKIDSRSNKSYQCGYDYSYTFFLHKTPLKIIINYVCEKSKTHFSPSILSAPSNLLPVRAETKPFITEVLPLSSISETLRFEIALPQIYAPTPNLHPFL